MNGKRLVFGTILGGIVLLVVSLIVSFFTQFVAPYDLFAIGGMRDMADPWMALYFVSPFVFALMATLVFDRIESVFKGTPFRRAMHFAAVIWALVTIPSLFMLLVTMTYPAGFYLENALYALLGYPLLGLVLVRM